MINLTEEQIMKNWQGDIQNPLVSVRCITYNHENHIAQALDGFFLPHFVNFIVHYPKIAQYIAIFRLSAVVPHLLTV